MQTARKSSVIKAETARPMSGALVKPFHFSDMMDEVTEALSSARSEAERLLADARQEADRICQKAWEEGRAEGLLAGEKEGRERGRAEAFEAASQEFAAGQKGLIESCRNIIDAVNAEREAWAASARQDLIDLAMAIARRVAHHVGERDRRVIVSNLEEAVQLAGKRSEVTVRVHPADVEAARQFAASMMAQRGQWQHVDVTEDPDVSAGGCRVQWGSGAVDARLETQLDRIAAALAADESACDSKGETVVE
jgi:flagellar assembly protein FliH